MNKQVVAYTKIGGPYCAVAKALLRQKDVDFTEIDITGNPRLRSEMIARSGRYTVPQIFVGEFHVGGCDDLFELESSGLLDDLLDRTAVPA
jgi:glutaredoxin 3